MIALIVGGVAYREMFNRGVFGVPSLPTTARSHPVNRSKPPQSAEPTAPLPTPSSKAAAPTK